MHKSLWKQRLFHISTWTICPKSTWIIQSLVASLAFLAVEYRFQTCSFMQEESSDKKAGFNLFSEFNLSFAKKIKLGF